MPVLECLTILAAVASIVSGLASAREIFGRLWRKITGKASDAAQVAQRLTEASRGIKERYDMGFARHGQTFAEGDEQARFKIMQILRDMDRKLVAGIEACQENAIKVPVFCTQMHDVICGLRQDTFNCLEGLMRRIQSNPSVRAANRPLISYRVPSQLSFSDGSDRISTRNWAAEPSRSVSVRSNSRPLSLSLSRVNYESPKIELTSLSPPSRNASDLERSLFGSDTHYRSNSTYNYAPSGRLGSDEILAENLRALQMN